MVSLKSLLIVAALASSSLAITTDNWNPTGAGCVDTDGYLGCYADALSDFTACGVACNQTTTAGTQTSQDCILGCGGHHLAAKVGCWISSCWNLVYSCEYQLTAATYFHDTAGGLVQNSNVPFYPPPDGAVGGECSCNLGYVYGNTTHINMNNCINSAANGDLANCECCQFSDAVSNVYNICPKSDLSVFEFVDKISSTQSLLSSSPDNCAILDSPNAVGNCASYGFTYYGDHITNPLSLSDADIGTEPLSNNPGNAFTDPGGDTFTLQLFPGYSSVLKLAPFNTDAGVATGGAIATGTGDLGATETPTGAAGTATGGAGAGTGTGKATGSNAAATSGTGTSTGAAAATSSTKPNGGSIVQKSGVLVGLVGIMTVMLLC